MMHRQSTLSPPSDTVPSCNSHRKTTFTTIIPLPGPSRESTQYPTSVNNRVELLLVDFQLGLLLVLLVDGDDADRRRSQIWYSTTGELLLLLLKELFPPPSETSKVGLNGCQVPLSCKRRQLVVTSARLLIKQQSGVQVRLPSSRHWGVFFYFFGLNRRWWRRRRSSSRRHLSG